MPAESPDYCPVCNTAPCSHPEPTLTLGVVLRDRHESYAPLLRDLATLVTLGLLGWVLVVVLAALGPFA
jgi:hypothetical protein